MASYYCPHSMCGREVREREKERGGGVEERERERKRKKEEERSHHNTYCISLCYGTCASLIYM